MKKQAKSALGMVNVGHKEKTRREAIAVSKIRMTPSAFAILETKGSPKGDCFETARVAAIMAAKNTPSIIPLCHPLEINQVNVTFKADRKNSTIAITVLVSSWGRTGVEMEALTAATAGALTIYDMMKWADRAMVISETKLLYKAGGKSGTFGRK